MHEAIAVIRKVIGTFAIVSVFVWFLVFMVELYIQARKPWPPLVIGKPSVPKHWRPAIPIPGARIIRSSCVQDKSRPYKCKINAELSKLLIDENRVIAAKVKKSLETLAEVRQEAKSDQGRADFLVASEYNRFSNQAKELHWAKDIGDLRNEVQIRIPSAKDIDELQHWQRCNHFQINQMKISNPEYCAIMSRI
jgi:hypothetical protein